MEKVFREIRCVSIEKNDVKFIPENLVKKHGYLDKHGLMVQELQEKVIESKTETTEPDTTKESIQVAEAEKENTEKKATNPTDKIKVDA